MKEELLELKMKVTSLETKLQSADNQIDNLLEENLSLNKKLLSYEKKIEMLSRICISTPMNNKKERKSLIHTV